MLRILIEKAARTLTVADARDAVIFQCPIALGRTPQGPKTREGDGKTPEGDYFVCLKKMGKYGPSLGVSYPNVQDALRGGADETLTEYIRACEARHKRPPWGTQLGGEIYIHGGGTASDWTAGCIALDDGDARQLYDLIPEGTSIRIL